MHRTALSTLLLLAAPTLLATSVARAEQSKARPSPAEVRVVNARARLEANGHALRSAPWTAEVPLASLSNEHGIDPVPAPIFELPMQDNEFYLAEDEVLGAGSGPKPLRFAVPIEVALDVADGAWIEVDGGRLWRVVVGSPNATTARVRLTGLDLPPGHEIRLSSPGWEGSTVGPLEGVGEFGNGEAWSMSFPTGDVLLEWFVPEGARAKGLPFGGLEYYHGYRDIWRLGGDGGGEGGGEGGGDGGVAGAGSCHLDPICFPTWADESNGVVRLIFGGFFCSGQLTATTAADETPYVSTANHCISTQSEATSCQFNFFYRRNVCSASATASAGTSITGGDLVVTQAASDCTLLMIRPTLPTTVYWVGWTNASVPVGTASTGLHHPAGDYQRISFGTKNASSFNCGSPTTNYSSLSWNSATQNGVTTTGVTEGGSSGSAIYRNSDQKMYGVLTCGGSSCGSPSLDDGYGRWDVAVSSGGFASPLAAGSDDTMEPNDTCAAAIAATPGTSYSNMVVKRLDEDWYRLPVPSGSSVSVSMTFTHGNGDVDVELYSACGQAPVLQRLGNVSNESFSYANSTSSNAILMRVFLGADVRNNYSFSFTVTTPVPPNDDCASATIVADGIRPFNTEAATNSALAIPASCTDGAGSVMNKDVWYRYEASCSGTAIVSTCGTAPFDTRIVVYTGSSCPSASTSVLACNDDDTANACGVTSTVTFEVEEGLLYVVRLGSKSNVGGAGEIEFACVPGSACPADVDGNGVVDATDLANLLAAWGPCAGCPADVDGNGSVDATDLANLLAAWGACQ